MRRSNLLVPIPPGGSVMVPHSFRSMRTRRRRWSESDLSVTTVTECNGDGVQRWRSTTVTECNGDGVRVSYRRSEHSRVYCASGRQPRIHYRWPVSLRDHGFWRFLLYSTSFSVLCHYGECTIWTHITLEMVPLFLVLLAGKPHYCLKFTRENLYDKFLRHYPTLYNIDICVCTVTVPSKL